MVLGNSAVIAFSLCRCEYGNLLKLLFLLLLLHIAVINTKPSPVSHCVPEIKQQVTTPLQVDNNSHSGSCPFTGANTGVSIGMLC